MAFTIVFKSKVCTIWFFYYFLLYFSIMKILKVYDKINRIVLQCDALTGNITIREFFNDTDYYSIIINSKIFKSKNDNMTYFSFVSIVDNITKETLDITNKYIFYSSYDNGRLIHSDRISLKDNKSIVTIDRIYDVFDDFLELENHKGKKTIKFKIKKEIINKFLKKK